MIEDQTNQEMDYPIYDTNDTNFRTTDSDQHQITIVLHDLMGAPITGLIYAVENDTKVVAYGTTNGNGETKSIPYQIGDVLEVFVEDFETTKMKLVKRLPLDAAASVVRLRSGKAVFDVDLEKHEGDKDKYVRKTYIVKSGDTLDGIAKQNSTTARELTRLNDLKDENHIYVGQVIKLPLKQPNTGGGSGGGDSGAAALGASGSTGASATSATPSAANPGAAPSSPATPSAANPNAAPANNAAPKPASAAAPATAANAPAASKPPVAPPVGVVDKKLVPVRSENSGTPKANLEICKDQSNCIKKGEKSPLIEEINIRLAGFGGALPTDEFTDLTEKCIKQFQKDYMGAAETGRICGGLLKALDEFMGVLHFADYFPAIKCPCGQCTGFGNGLIKDLIKIKKKNGKDVPYTAIEYPGIHRSLLWAFRASNFYMTVMEKNLGYTIKNVESGYRCIERNVQKNRDTTNHMGMALDVHYFNKGGKVSAPNADIEIIRDKIFVRHLGAQRQWPDKNKVSLENTSDGATTWVHFDVREFTPKLYLQNKFFVKSAADADGGRLVDLANKLGKTQLSLCGGAPTAPPKPQEPSGVFTVDDAKKALRYIYDKYGKEIAEKVEVMYLCETTRFTSIQYQKCGCPGMQRGGSAPAPYYGWDKTLFTELPIGLLPLFEGKGLSDQGGEKQDTTHAKEYLMFKTVQGPMEFLARYLQKYNGNCGHWNSGTDKSIQDKYNEELTHYIPRIVRGFEKETKGK